MDNYEKEILAKKIKRLYKKGLLNNKKIVLFGVSPDAKIVKTVLCKYNFSPESIIDNDLRKIDTKCMGMTVQTPENRLSMFDQNALILIYSLLFYKEMSYQLDNLGYKKNKNYFCLNSKIDEMNFVNMVWRLIRGYFLYKKFHKNKNDFIFAAPYTGTGDIYLAGLYFNDYIRREKIDNYTFLVVSGACKKTAAIFNIKNVVVVKSKYVEDLINYNSICHNSLNIKMINDGWKNNIQWLRGYNGLNFERMFRYFVFGFSDDYKLIHPLLPDRQTEVDGIFEKYGLIKHKTAVLSPYSNTLFDLPNDFLEEVVKLFSSRGYPVCTNCAGDEKPVVGTKSIFFPLDIAKQFMDNAGVFIGVRSGLCDIISNSTCKKIIFYEKDSFFYKSSPLEYFSLKEMGLCDDVTEIEYSDDNRDKAFEIIEQCFDD